MSTERVGRWYRLLREDGTLWCESSNPVEVTDSQAKLPADEAVIYQVLEVYRAPGPWREWTPGQAIEDRDVRVLVVPCHCPTEPVADYWWCAVHNRGSRPTGPVLTGEKEVGRW